MDLYLNQSDNDLKKEEYLDCEICDREYNQTNHFHRHLTIFHEMTPEEYQLEYYNEYIPNCVECGKKSHRRKNNTWFTWVKACEKHEWIIKRINHQKSHLKNSGKYDKYKVLQIEYWLNERGFNLLRAFKLIKFLLKEERYKRFSDNWFDESWTEKGIKEHRKKLIKMKDYKIPSILSKKGWKYRGWENYKEKHRQYMNSSECNHKTIFSDPEFQRKNSLKCHKKYSSEEWRHFTPWCEEYWMDRGYKLEEAKEIISDIQSRDKDYFIDKYGKNEGLKRYNDMIEKRKKKWYKKSDTNKKEITEKRVKRFPDTNDLDDYINKYGQKKGRIKYANRYWSHHYGRIDTIKEYNEIKDKIEQKIQYPKKFYDEELRKTILKEQNYECGNPECKMKNKDCIFHLHHINYKKKDCRRKNLIYLCNSCHSETNHKKEKFVKKYKKVNELIMEECDE